ncbi:MAG: hypothetical protein ACRERD_32480, partial [Candidatus Binatia bacterium]
DLCQRVNASLYKHAGSIGREGQNAKRGCRSFQQVPRCCDDGFVLEEGLVVLHVELQDFQPVHYVLETRRVFQRPPRKTVHVQLFDVSIGL